MCKEKQYKANAGYQKGYNGKTDRSYVCLGLVFFFDNTPSIDNISDFSTIFEKNLHSRHFYNIIKVVKKTKYFQGVLIMNIKSRNIVTAIILTIVTCGIYGIYWAICMAREAVSVKDPSDSGMLEIVLFLFLPFLGFFLAEQKLSAGCAEKGIEHKDNSVLYLILGLIGLGIINYCMMQSDLNKIAETNV